MNMIVEVHEIKKLIENSKVRMAPDFDETSNWVLRQCKKQFDEMYTDIDLVFDKIRQSPVRL